MHSAAEADGKVQREGVSEQLKRIVGENSMVKNAEG